MPMNPRLLRPLATGFNPKSIAGLAVWLDMSKESSVTLNGSTVSQVNDLSGNGLHATQPTAANQPTYASTINGRRVVTTTDSPATNLFVVDPVAANTGLSLFAVLRREGSSSRHLTFGVGANSEQVTAGATGWVALFQSGINAAASFANNTTQAAVPGGFSNNETAVFALTHSGSEIINYKNGSASATGSSVVGLSATFARLYISGRTDAGVNATPQSAGEVLLYTRVVSAAERQRIERYLGKKWGVTVA